MSNVGTTVRIRGWRGGRALVAVSAGASAVLALAALLGRSAPASKASPAASGASVPQTEAYAIPPDVRAIPAAPERGRDDGDDVVVRAQSAPRKVTMAAREPRGAHERKQAASRASASEAAPTSPPPLPESGTRTRVRLVDDEARVRILE